MGGVLGAITVTHTALRHDFGIARPRIALCALNPHAGEGGAFGDEEKRLLAPALQRARRLKFRVSGPHPADSVYARRCPASSTRWSRSTTTRASSPRSFSTPSPATPP